MGERDELEEGATLQIKSQALSYESYVFLGQDIGKMGKFSQDT